MRLFPYARFLGIWDSLTWSQQEDWFQRFGQKQSTPQRKLVSKEYNRTRLLQSETDSTASKSTKSLKSDQTLFRNASITKTWVEKRNEAK